MHAGLNVGLVLLPGAQVLQGMVFVWGSASPNAALESEAKPVPGIPEMEQTEQAPRMTVDGRRAFANLPVGALPVCPWKPTAALCYRSPAVGCAKC